MAASILKIGISRNVNCDKIVGSGHIQALASSLLSVLGF